MIGKTEQLPDPGFGLYLHWPFCAAKCPYCDFNSHVRHTAPDQKRYVEAFKREMEHMAGLIGPQKLTSIFMGGGTPSLMHPETVAALLEAAQSLFKPEDGLEITLEANPTSIEAERFKGYAEAGVNRVSIGVQSLRDESLKFLGRLHSASEARDAIEIATSTFARVSIDLIYARADQTLESWRDELREAMTLGLKHLSLYQLTIEPETPFEALFKAGKKLIPDTDLARQYFEETQEITELFGVPAYEVSNHAAKGEESRHNLVYWRYGTYAGVGPGAHGRLIVNGQRRAFSTEKRPEAWLSSVEQNGHGIIINDPLSEEEQGDEFLLMGLRLFEGINPKRYKAIAGHGLDERRIKALMQEGMLEKLDNGNLRANRDGWLVLDALVADLAA
jgi:putative oxygen-independent coproporphyrinogen III oxidase